MSMWSDPSSSPNPPYPYEPMSTPDEIKAWQNGWRYGWGKGVEAGMLTEARARTIKTKKLDEIAACISVLDEWGEDAAMSFLRKVFFPSRWDVLVWKVSRGWRRFRRITKHGNS